MESLRGRRQLAGQIDYLLRGGWLDGSLQQEAGSYGYYWSSIPLVPDYAYYLYFSSGTIDTFDPSFIGYRYYGFSVRCVAAG